MFASNEIDSVPYLEGIIAIALAQNKFEILNEFLSDDYLNVYDSLNL